jgi:hypothetical protein
VREHGVGYDEATRHFLPAVGVCEPVMARRQAFYSRKWAGKRRRRAWAAGRRTR